MNHETGCSLLFGIASLLLLVRLGITTCCGPLALFWLITLLFRISEILIAWFTLTLTSTITITARIIVAVAVVATWGTTVAARCRCY